MKQKHTFFVTTGVPSLFLIFSVLCLCVLSLLTLGSARTDLSTAKHSMEQTGRYYEACRKATETVTEIRSALTGYADAREDADRYFSQAAAFADTKKGLTWNPDDHTLSFSTGITDTQQLSVVLEILYPTEKDSPLLQIRQWKTALTEAWNPDQHQNVYKGE